jgi:hypothetical protein
MFNFFLPQLIVYQDGFLLDCVHDDMVPEGERQTQRRCGRAGRYGANGRTESVREGAR